MEENEVKITKALVALNTTVAAGEIGNNHLGVYKQPCSPRRPLWLQKLYVHAKLAE